ncbi:hypothetical protein [Alkalibacillus silvisoli]|uniref:Uncharacterized protein n=1 Tax=Alkalibacillus silvisoli TaxID=392823 RepID=A0ABP3K5Q5_9BACI
MVVDAFIYMYVVGLGTSLGIGTVVWLGYKYHQRTNNKKSKGRKAVL